MLSTKDEDEREVVNAMQEEMRRYKAELMCPLCKVRERDRVLMERSGQRNVF